VNKVGGLRYSRALQVGVENVILEILVDEFRVQMTGAGIYFGAIINIFSLNSLLYGRLSLPLHRKIKIYIF
jgi:hypothetical protein